MKKIRTILILFFLFTQISCQRNRRDVIKSVGSWSTGPDVIVCVSAPVTRDHVSSAVLFWENLGHHFGDIHERKCKGYPRKGEIWISGASRYDDLDDDDFAGTSWAVNDISGEIHWAYIKIRTVKPRVLEHEIGHALGYIHIASQDHLMNFDYSRGGWKTDGLLI